jgi:hypothetical protein
MGLEPTTFCMTSSPTALALSGFLPANTDSCDRAKRARVAGFHRVSTGFFNYSSTRVVRYHIGAGLGHGGGAARARSRIPIKPARSSEGTDKRIRRVDQCRLRRR